MSDPNREVLGLAPVGATAADTASTGAPVEETAEETPRRRRHAGEAVPAEQTSEDPPAS